MTTKYVRGQLLVFTATPLDAAGAPMSPASVKLYLNYIHAADGTASTDSAVDMELQTDGSYMAEFDTGDIEPGPVFASIRTESPASAADLKFTITANAANPLDATTS